MLCPIPIGALCQKQTHAAAANERSYSITSSARREGGRNLEAERLGGLEVDISSNLVGCSTGRSAGFAPLRILST